MAMKQQYQNRIEDDREKSGNLHIIDFLHHKIHRRLGNGYYLHINRAESMTKYNYRAKILTKKIRVVGIRSKKVKFQKEAIQISAPSLKVDEQKQAVQKFDIETQSPLIEVMDASENTLEVGYYGKKQNKYSQINLEIIQKSDQFSQITPEIKVKLDKQSQINSPYSVIIQYPPVPIYLPLPTYIITHSEEDKNRADQLELQKIHIQKQFQLLSNSYQQYIFEAEQRQKNTAKNNSHEQNKQAKDLSVKVKELQKYKDKILDYQKMLTQKQIEKYQYILDDIDQKIKWLSKRESNLLYFIEENEKRDKNKAKKNILNKFNEDKLKKVKKQLRLSHLEPIKIDFPEPQSKRLNLEKDQLLIDSLKKQIFLEQKRYKFIDVSSDKESQFQGGNIISMSKFNQKLDLGKNLQRNKSVFESFQTNKKLKGKIVKNRSHCNPQQTQTMKQKNNKTNRIDSPMRYKQIKIENEEEQIQKLIGLQKYFLSKRQIDPTTLKTENLLVHLQDIFTKLDYQWKNQLKVETILTPIKGIKLFNKENMIIWLSNISIQSRNFEQNHSQIGVQCNFQKKNIYKGQFIQDKKSGFGIEIFQQDIYSGEFLSDKRNGKGLLKFTSNNQSYEGQFLQNKFHGEGIYKWSNGDQFEGFFNKNQKEGYGLYKHFNGDKYLGFYKNNLKHGEGKYIYANGTIFEGFYANNLKHGNGKLTNQNRIIYGVWQYDEFKQSMKANENISKHKDLMENSRLQARKEFGQQMIGGSQ